MTFAENLQFDFVCPLLESDTRLKLKELEKVLSEKQKIVINVVFILN